MKKTFTLSPSTKLEKPSQTKKKAPRKVVVQDIMKKPNETEKIKIPEFDFDDYDSDSYSDSGDIETECEIEDEMEKYDGNSRKELFEIYKKELRIYEEYMEKVSYIIDKKASMSN